MPKTLEVKRTEAQARQEAYDSLSVDQRIKRAKSRRGNSRKELARLKATLAKANA